MPFVGDAAVSGCELEQFGMLRERVLQIWMALKGAKHAAKLNMLINSQVLVWEKQD
jgi:hypothetical protein